MRTQQVPGPDPVAAVLGGTSMRALVQDRYGSPDVLVLDRVPVPAPGAGEVLIRVQAASVNARDWHIMRGEPRLARLMDRTVFGRTGPKVRIRGTDFAGTVEAVGAGVTRWGPGDAVFGEADGAIAEFLTASAEHVAAIPAGTTPEQAAALPLAGSTALACLLAGDPQSGQRVLINGASGGVGTFAVQLAVSMGLHVTAVCSARNADLVASLGAQAVVDYRRKDFVRRGHRHEIVIDLVGNRTLADLFRVLEPGGTLVLSGGGVPGEGRLLGPLGMLVRAKLVAALSRLRIVVPRAEPSGPVLAQLAELTRSAAITPVVDRTFAFEDAAEAIRYLETEHARAKVVIALHR